MAPTNTDILGAPYIARTLELKPDNEGEVVATLVHRPADGPSTGKAVLHVHGFADYFFQTPAADFCATAGTTSTPWICASTGGRCARTRLRTTSRTSPPTTRSSTRP